MLEGAGVIVCIGDNAEVYDCDEEGERLVSGDDDPVFELVKDCDGLDECVDVLEVVVVVLTDVDTLDDFVGAVLPVCDTDTVEVFELVWLSVDSDDAVASTELDTEALEDPESDGILVIDACGDVETVSVAAVLTEPETELVSL